MVNPITVITVALLLLIGWQVIRRLSRSAAQRTSPPPQPPSLEQRLRHLPLSDRTLLAELEQRDGADQVLARAVLRQRLVNYLRVREDALRQQEQWLRQRVLAVLQEVQRQRFEASLDDLLPTTPTPEVAPAVARTVASAEWSGAASAADAAQVVRRQRTA